MKRRDFLKAAAITVPAIWIPRRAFGRTAAHGKVKHLLVLYAKGGFRSHATFNAVGTTQHNPWGTQPAAAGTDWVLGAACGSADITTAGGTIDGFAKRTQNVAVLACVDHLPGGRTIDVDHRTASNRIGTGSPEGALGLLSMIGKDHPRYANGFTLDAVPPVEIAPSEFGAGGAEFSKYRPLGINAPEESFGSEVVIENGWHVTAREKMDARFRAKKPAAFDTRLENFLLAKKNTATFAGMLRDPLLDLTGAPDSASGGVTNRELLDVLGSGLIPNDPEMVQGWGPSIALALRFFAFGSPACVVTRDIYDMHDAERDGYGPRSADLVRQLAGLDHVLRRMTHPDGGTYWDHTLVAVVSEFSRNNTSEVTGFNSGNGSDHVPEEGGPCRNQAIAVMGGIVRAGGKLIGSTDAEMNATGTVFSSRSLLSTFLDVLGIGHENYWADRPIEELF